MKKEFYTDKEVEKLRDCEILQSDYVTWKGGKKFLRRGIGSATVLSRYRENEWIPVTYNCTKVRVDGRVLEYIPSYSFTNQKKPI